MINGFEIETKELTTEELRLANKIAPHLSKKRGKAAIVTNAQMTKGMEKTWDIKIGDARMRKIINHLRITGKVPCLIATNRGYYVASTVDEINEYITSLYQRAGAIIVVADALNKQKAIL